MSQNKKNVAMQIPDEAHIKVVYGFANQKLLSMQVQAKDTIGQFKERIIEEDIGFEKEGDIVLKLDGKILNDDKQEMRELPRV